MKYFWSGAGLLLVIGSLASIGKYVLAYKSLSPYGQGYVWGNVILLFMGAAFLYFGLKKKRIRS